MCLDPLLRENESSYLEVREALPLGSQEELPVKVRYLLHCRQTIGGTDDALELVEEPSVDLRQLMDLVYSVAHAEGLTDSEDTRICRCLEGAIEFGGGDLLGIITYEAVHPLSDHTEALLHRLFERASDGHHFPYRLHTAT